MKMLALAGAMTLALMNASFADQTARNNCAAPYGKDCTNWQGTADSPSPAGEGADAE